MINNSSLALADRLNSKNLDAQFKNLMIQGLNCSSFEAEAVVETVHKVYANQFAITKSIKTGQIQLQVISIEARVNAKLSESKQITATLTLSDEKNDLSIRKDQGVTGLRRHKLKRICQEAYDQGGLLTVEDLAYRIFNCGMRTINRDLAYFKAKEEFIPLRSTIKDMGRSISHRELIIKLWAQGKEYSEISRESNHSLESIQNYVSKFKRTVLLYKEGYPVAEISYLIKLSSSIVEEYKKIYDDFDFIEHRREELRSIIKKRIQKDITQEVK